MRVTLLSSAAAAAILTVLTAMAAEKLPRPEFQAMSFLAGHCWKGTFPGTQMTDEHCFSWVYGGRFMRDRHVVHRGARQPDALGETIYFWDSSARQLHYFYIESEGKFIRGTVANDGATLRFPESTYVEDGQEQSVRSQWKPVGEDAYDVVTEFRMGAEWKPGFNVHMRRSGPASEP